MDDKKKPKKDLIIAMSRLLFWCVVIIGCLIVLFIDVHFFRAIAMLASIVVCVCVGFKFIIKYSDKHWR